VAGSRSRSIASKGAAGRAGNSSMEGVSGHREVELLTELGGKVALAAGSGWRHPGLVRDRGRQKVDPHTSFAEDNAADRGPSLRGLADIGARQDSEMAPSAGSAACCAEESTEARIASSNAKRPGMPGGVYSDGW